MKPYSITLLSKQPGDLLSDFLYAQLSEISWLKRTIISASKIKQAPNDSLLILPLQDTSFREIIDICAACKQTDKRYIAVSIWKNRLLLGPAYFPGKTAGIDSCLAQLHQESVSNGNDSTSLNNLTTAKLDESLLEQHLPTFYSAFAVLLNEIKIIRDDKPAEKLKLVDHIYEYNFKLRVNSRPESKYIYPLFENSVKEDGSDKLIDYKILLGKFSNSIDQIKDLAFNGQQQGVKEDEYNNVAVIGGGTAGYVTALLLKKNFPGMPVTLIESSKIPVIGVGEATTPEIRRFLFESLGFSPHDFYETVKPTWKLGIKFFWGLPGDYYFNYPFGSMDLKSAYVADGNINQSSLTAVLMDNDSSFVVAVKGEDGKEKYSTLSDDLFYALHIENKAFVSYLKKKADEMGIIYKDALIVDAERKTDTEGLQAVIDEQGVRHEYDFYVDCTGFRSLLLEKTLGVPFVPYKNSLFNDTAVVGCIKDVEKVKPYTYAESMHHGWCWNIALRGEDHRGYVFSSAHCSTDEAYAELKAKNPGIETGSIVKFRSGRHGEICTGNLFAIGNSFAFVEPLESTGIHMIIKEAKTLVYSFRNLKKSAALRKKINDDMNSHWDYLRDFLALHFKYNRKFDTPYWKDCREETDVSGVQWMIDLYNEIGLLSSADKSLKRMILNSIKDDIFGLYSFDVIMLGQGMVPKNFDLTMRNRRAWEAQVKNWRSIRSLTVPIAKDLDILTQYLESKW
jgi:flavin-dependent dehydrogenase